MNQYFIARNGQQIGPFSPEQLRQQGIRRNDMVWCTGMTDWKQAGSIVELNSLFPQYGNQQGYQANPAPRPNPYAAQQQTPRRAAGLMVMSIFGIIGSLVQLLVSIGFYVSAASQRHGYYFEDDCYYASRQATEAYNVSATVLLISGIFFLVLSIIGIAVGSRKTVRA